MLLLPKEFLSLMLLFAPLFSADLAEGFRAGYGCSTWETNGECDFAGDGFA